MRLKNLMTKTRCIAAAAMLLAVPSFGADATTTASAMRFLKRNCFSCHNPEKHKGSLVMTSRDQLLQGAESGPAVVVGDPEQSAMIRALAREADPHMPPKKQVSAKQIALLSQWVKDGAPWDANALLDPPDIPRAVTLETLPVTYHPVLALALSPDNTRLAAGWGNELIIFSVSEKELSLVMRSHAHPDPVQAITWSPDGKRLVTGAFRRLVVWDAATLTEERHLTEGITDRVTAVRFLPALNQVVFADGRVTREGIVRIADVETGVLIASWSAHTDTIFDLALSTDGKLLATAGGDKLIKLWELPSQQEKARLEGHVAQVLALAFSADGTQLVTGGADQQLRVWDVQTKERMIALGTHSSALNAIAWVPGGAAVFAVTGAGGLLRYTDLKAHGGAQSSESASERKMEEAADALCSLAVTTNADRIFAGSHDGQVLGWNKEGKIINRISLESAQPVLDHPPTFTRDVLPVLNKAGCSAGACHAKPDGQNGFNLTVFSYDPKADYHDIVKEARGRRVFPAAPEESLLLLKPTLAVPHEGGERFDRDSDAYRTLVAWIRSGMIFRAENEPVIDGLEVSPRERTYRKGASEQLLVRAHYADGSVRDVTPLATFDTNDKDIASVTEDGFVRIGKAQGQAVIVARFMGLVADSQVLVPADRLLPESQYAPLRAKNFIDQLAYARFKQLGLFPSDGCTDAEFLRRASLDAIGTLPVPAEARAFLADTDPLKREKLIDRLLADPSFADYWANQWADLFRPNPDRVGVKSVYLLDQWLRESFRANKPYDQFAREILLAEGNTHQFGPTVIFRDRREPADLTTIFSQLFLGVRIECAKCHHHPNEKWGQDDFYQLAAFFGPLRQKGAGISPPISGGNETFYFAPGKEVKHPITGVVMTPRPPDGPLIKTAATSDPRRALADWMTSDDNPFFSRAIVNRVWAGFFGKGLVEPVDDFRISNPPAHPALLDALAREFVRQKFDLKSLMRTIMCSQLYQLSSMPNEWNRSDTRNFSRVYRRRLPAEVMADALADVTGVPDFYDGMPPGSRALQAWTYKIKSRTMDAFGRPNASSDCPCLRDARPSIVQSLHLMNSRSLQAKLASTDSGSRVQQLVSGELPPAEIVAELYLACYSRQPTGEELQIATAAFNAEGATRRSAIEDLLWALLNSAEFVFNH